MSRVVAEGRNRRPAHAGAKAPLDDVLMRDGFPSFSREEIARRHAALREMMEGEGIALLAAYGAGRFNAEMLYLTNWPGGREGYFLLPHEGNPRLLVQLFNHVPLAQQLSLGADTEWAGPDSVATVARAIEAQGADRENIGLVGTWAQRDFQRLAALLPHARFRDVQPQYRALRSVRSAEELRFFREAAALTDASMMTLQGELRPGLLERDLAAIVERVYLESGGYPAIHFISSTPMSDPHTFVPHQYQSDRRISAGDVVITEISGSFWGYASQIHRTYTVGAVATDEYARLHEVAVEAFEAIVGVLRHGADVDDVLDAADIIRHRGYTIFDDLLHGADQYPPILRTRETDHGHPADFRFQENMVITVQPHVITHDRRIGLQFGETVRITREGAEFLHDYPRQIIELIGRPEDGR